MSTPTIADVIRQSVEHRSRNLRQVRADQFKKGMYAFLWVETGSGSLERVNYINSDGWVVTGTGGFDQRSWCCGPETPLYLPGDYQTLIAWEAKMKQALAENRGEKR